MKRKILSAISALVLVATVFAVVPTMADSIATRFKGHLLLSVEESGQLWYVHPDYAERIFLAPNQAWFVIDELATDLTNEELELIPLPGATTVAAEAQSMRKQYAGRFVRANSLLWYIHPDNMYRYYIGNPNTTVANLGTLATGISKVHLAEVKILGGKEPVLFNDPVVVTPEPVINKVEEIKKPEVNDMKMVWDFSHGLYEAYLEYWNDYMNYPDIKYFKSLNDNYDLPIYFQETGFQLDPGQTNYFVWSNHSPEFDEFLNEYFIMERVNNRLLIGFYIESEFVAEDYGLLSQGWYYFTNTDGLLNAEEFEGTQWDLVLNGDKKADAERVAQAAWDLHYALQEGFGRTGGYPIVFETPIELGEHGATMYTSNGGFFGKETDFYVFLNPVPSGFPSTRFIYDSNYSGKGYSIEFDLYGESEDFEPGHYRIDPLGIHRTGPVQVQE